MHYIYGGYVLTGGKIDGKDWKGINVMLACVNDGEDFPTHAEIGKASGRNAEHIMKQVQSMPVGCPCVFSCDLKGKLLSISPAK